MRKRSHEIKRFNEISKQPESEMIGESQSCGTQQRRAGQWITLSLCAMVLVAGIFEQLMRNGQDYAANFAPAWIPFVAAVIAAGGIIRLNFNQRWIRVQAAMLWIGLLLMVWTANGLPFILLRVSPVKSSDFDWPGLATRLLALVTAIMLGRIVLTQKAATASNRSATWYAYAAFVLALPYPVLRICWAFGGTIGITIQGAAGSGFAPLLFAIPWVLAAVLSLFLVSTPSWMPRRLLLIAGWTATAIVSMIGPLACWFLVTQLIAGTLRAPEGMKIWVPCLFYSSWFLWAIAAGAATRSYQLRSAITPDILSNVTDLQKASFNKNEKVL
jgi:hypothetical protein